MKQSIMQLKAIFSFLFVFFLYSVTFAQYMDDDVKGIEGLRARLSDNIKTIKANPHLKNNAETFYVPIKFHLVGDSDGQGRLNYNNIFQELCDLNGQFEEVGMQFYIDGGFNEFDHGPTYQSPTSAGATTKMIIEKNNAGANSVNVFVTQNANSGNIENGNTLGFYQNNSDYVVIRKNQLGIGNSTLAHEIGHLFSLDHPHRGWEDQPWDLEIHGRRVTRSSVSSSQSGGSVRVELVDRSNCDESGDMLCDTPPDYNFGFTWNEDCPRFNTIVLDRNSDTIVPMQNNYMSYFLGCEPYQFTQDQTDVINADYNSSKRSNIRSSYVPNTATIEEEVEILSHESNATTDFYNGVHLEWTNAESADGYFLNITGGGDDFRILTTDTAYFMTQLNPGKIYTMSVTPYNETGGCASRKSIILKTNELSTSTNDPAIEGKLYLAQNPIFRGEQILLIIESEQRAELQAKLYSSSGQLHIQNTLNVELGPNRFQISNHDLAPGIYILHLESEQGVSSRKVIVQ